MDSINLRIKRRGREVWSVDELPWAKVLRDNTEPYTFFRFDRE